jgi:putative hydrolase of the HAD superfamily
MPIQTVFFDMGGTIDTYWHSPEMRLAATPGLQAYLLSHGIDLYLSDLQLYHLITNGLRRYHQWRLKTLEEIPTYQVWRDYILADYPETFPVLESISEDLMIWYETHYYERHMRPEIPSVLQSLKQLGLKIGLISNVNSRNQVPINLQQYGIKEFFNPIVLSSIYSRRKPDPAIFHHAARLSNSPTSECIYIGDRISRDIVGAKRAGFKLAIQISHDFDHGESDDGATPDVVIKNMTELVDLVRREYHSCQEIPRSLTQDKPIRAVLFDADGVLYYRKNKDVELNSFIKHYGQNCSVVPESEINLLRHRAFTGQMTFKEYKIDILKLYGITDSHLLEQGLQKAIREKTRVLYFANTLDTLKALKERSYYLGIVTDTTQPLHLKIEKLERGGFGHLWDSIIPSNEVGVQKPDPRIYQLALNQLGIEPERAIFVGHNTNELQGARKTGMKTVAFNYDRDAQADFYIKEFAELANLDILS